MNNLSLLLTTAILVTLFSCSHLNQTERREYDRREEEIGQPFRHGIVPESVFEENGKVIPKIVSSESIKRGKIVYQQNCLKCHGRFGRGDGPESSTQKRRVKNIARLAKDVPNFKFFMKMSIWKGDMPGWVDALSEKDISDLESYIIYLSRVPRN